MKRTKILVKIANFELMSRGATLFSTLFDEPVDNKIDGPKKTLTEKRNECLLDRLYFYKKQFPWKYEYIMERLRDEFFLSEVTIPQIIEKPENQLYLRTLHLEKPTKELLKKKWPHLLWAAA